MGTVPIEKYPFDCGTMPAAWIISELIRLSDEEYHIIGLEQHEMVDDLKVVKCIELDEVRRRVSPRPRSGLLLRMYYACTAGGGSLPSYPHPSSVAPPARRSPPPAT